MTSPTYPGPWYSGGYKDEPDESTPVMAAALNRFDAFNAAVATYLATLGGAALLNVGTAAGTVAAGNDSRFGTSSGALTRNAATSAGNATLGTIDAIDTTSGTFARALPAASAGRGRIVMKWEAGTVAPTIALTGSDHVNTSSGSIPTFKFIDQAMTFESDGVSLWTRTSVDLPVGQLDLRYLGIVTATGLGADPTGTVDATALLQSALNVGGAVLLNGTFLITSPLTMSVAGTTLMGVGRVAGLKIPTSGWSGAQAVQVTADRCSLTNLSIFGASSTWSSNPAADGVLVNARYCTMRDVDFRYLNGWAVKWFATSTASVLGGVIDNMHLINCGGGIWTLGNSAQSSYGMQLQAVDLNLETTKAHECIRIEDSNDVQIGTVNGAVDGSITMPMIEVIGASSTVELTNIDVGQFPVPGGGPTAPTIQIDSNGNGTPGTVRFSNGTAQAGLTNLTVNACKRTTFTNIDFKHSWGTNVVVAGGTVRFDACTFDNSNDGAVGGTPYDLSITQSSGNTYVNDCEFQTAVGTTTVANNISNPVNDVNHKGYFYDSFFTGSGVTPSLVFATSPQIVRNCVGYNPRGNITAPTISGSPFTPSASQNDICIIFTAVNGMTNFSIGGQALGLAPPAGQSFRIPARQTVTVTYSGTAPTWLWIAE